LNTFQKINSNKYLNIAYPISGEPNGKLLDKSFLAEECTKWLDTIHDILTKETSSVLSHVHNISGLSNIRKSVHEYMKTTAVTSKWNEMCESLLGHKLSLWEEFYRHLFRDRVEAIVSTQIAGSIYYLQSSLGDLPKSTVQEPVISYMMSEIGLNEIVMSSNEDQKSLLTLKARAFTPAVQNMCLGFNGMLETAINDLNEYIRSSSLNVEAAAAMTNGGTTNFFHLYLENGERNDHEDDEPFVLDLDNDAILKFMQQSITQHMDSLLAFVTKHVNDWSKVHTGRLFQAMPELCPALRTCTSAPKLLMVNKLSNDYVMFNNQSKSSASASSSSSGKSDPEWQEMKAKLEEKAKQLFSQWVQSQVAILKSDITESLTTCNGSNSMAIMPTWDNIEISEEAEEGGKTLTSTIRVPQQLSVSAFAAFVSFCRQIYTVGPHSLPMTTQSAISQEAALAFSQAYNDHCGQVDQKLTQNVALQLHFDLQFVSQGMISRDKKGPVANLCQEALTSLEAHIDPFDYSVFAPYISGHVKRTILRNASIFSAIIPSDRFALLASMKSSIPASTPSSRLSSGTTSVMANGCFEQHEHNVMLLSASCGRFALLPVSSSVHGGHRGRGRDVKRGGGANSLTASNLTSARSPMTASASSSAARKRSKSPVARAAGSFFEAMSTSWFGGK
jgi:hypothetical protein